MHRVLHNHDGTTRQIHLGGWRKQLQDPRDAVYSLKLHGALTSRPASYDNRPICSPIEDQGDIGSCTAHMFAALVEANEIKRLGHGPSQTVLGANGARVWTSNVHVDANGDVLFTSRVRATPQPAPPDPGPQPTPTPTPPQPTPTPVLERVCRLAEYYFTRVAEGTPEEDSGATIRDAIKTGATWGVADEKLWPYDTSKFTQKPPADVDASAATHKISSYHAITDGDLETMKSSLAAGFLVGFGFLVYSSMMSAEVAKTGILPMPAPRERLEGGHAVALVGYDDAKGMFLVRNSWGTGWGQDGYFWMPYSYVGNTKLASDFWIVQSAPI